MDHPVYGVDHVVLLVHDLDAAAARYRRLGFTVSPKGSHSPEKGTANHTIMLDRNYVELLGVVTPTADNAPQRASLDRGEGPAAIAGRVDDARAAAGALSALGFATTEPFDFERPVELAAGGVARAAFSTTTFAPGVVPHGFVFLCQHRTPETVWLPELMAHPNGARTLVGVEAAVEAPGATAAAYARLFANAVVQETEGGADVRAGDVTIAFRTPPELAARYPDLPLPRSAYAVLRFAVADLAEACDVVSAAGVATRPIAGGFAVAPDDAAGAILAFVGS